MLRYYGFQAKELLSEKNPNFDERIDPKCFWAISHLDQFPVEINTASHDLLLRVPGIGPTGVKKIVSARRYGSVTFPMLKQMGIVLKRAKYFITCNGRMMERIPIEEKFILGQLAGLEEKKNKEIQKPEDNYHQMMMEMWKELFLKKKQNRA